MKVREMIEHLNEFSPELDLVMVTELGLSHIEEPTVELHDNMTRKIVIICPIPVCPVLPFITHLGD